MKKQLLLLIPTLLIMTACGQKPASSSSSTESKTTSSTTSETTSSTTSTSSSSSKTTSKSSSSSSSSSQKPVDPDFDDKNIILRAPVLSDEHCERTDPIDSSAQTTANIQVLTSLLGRTEFDIWLSAGDRSLTGTLAADQQWINAYTAGCSDSASKLFFCHGNHDVYWSECANLQQHYDWFSTNTQVYSLDSNDGQPAKGNRHAKVNGVHFVAIDVQTYMPGVNNFSVDTQTWFKNTMDAAMLDTPDMPIIVLCHCPPYETSTGSLNEQCDGGYWGGSKQLDEMLSDYPNAIAITGHTHYDIHDERAIMSNGKYHAITAPSLAGGLCLDTYYNGIFEPIYTMEGNERRYENSGVVDQISGLAMYKTSYGMYLEIDNKGATRITRYDLRYSKEIGNPWVIPSPKADKSHLEKYTARARMRVDEGPEFPETGHCTATRNSQNYINIECSAFTHQDLVYAYEFQIFDKEKTGIGDFDIPDERKVIFGGFWNKSIPSVNTFRSNKLHKGTYSVRVIALDVWGKYSYIWAN